jgi:hypothetical protein
MRWRSSREFDEEKRTLASEYWERYALMIGEL